MSSGEAFGRYLGGCRAGYCGGTTTPADGRELPPHFHLLKCTLRTLGLAFCVRAHLHARSSYSALQHEKCSAEAPRPIRRGQPTTQTSIAHARFRIRHAKMRS